MRAALAVALVGALAVSGCVQLPFGAKPEALDAGNYNRDVQVAVQTLSLVFRQADQSVRAFQQGWLAPEGAADQFSLLSDEVKDVKADISAARPPPNMEDFHRQLGRSVSLTQQAMDAMQTGFSSGDSAYFELAHDKLVQARSLLDKAVDGL
jgi:hypothetical protein